MVHAANKGKRFERDAVKHLAPLIGVERLHPEYGRKIGEGQAKDEGDLRMLPDVAFQVKAYADTGTALNQAVGGAAVQQKNARAAFGVGIVPIMKVRSTSVKWLAATTTTGWPVDIDIATLPKFGIVSKALAYVRDDTNGEREQRIVLVSRAAGEYILAPSVAWAAAYVAARPVPVPWALHD